MPSFKTLIPYHISIKSYRNVPTPSPHSLPDFYMTKTSRLNRVKAYILIKADISEVTFICVLCVCRCLPPYIKYKFHECRDHVSTEETQQKKTMKFNDRNVILLGTMLKGHLFEYLRGPALKIEVHDRDAKGKPTEAAAVFGSRVDDDAICNVAYTGGILLIMIDLLKENTCYGKDRKISSAINSPYYLVM